MIATEETVSAYVSVETAKRLVALVMDRDEKGRYGGKYWQLDEALQMALEEIAANDLGR